MLRQKDFSVILTSTHPSSGESENKLCTRSNGQSLLHESPKPKSLIFSPHAFLHFSCWENTTLTYKISLKVQTPVSVLHLGLLPFPLPARGDAPNCDITDPASRYYIPRSLSQAPMLLAQGLKPGG